MQNTQESAKEFTRPMKTDLAISENHLHEVATLLNNLLADEYVLCTKTRNAHWNIQGPGFMGLHTFFEIQYGTLDIIADDIAERVRALGHFALGSLKNFLSVTNMLENDEEFVSRDQIIQTLLSDHETIIRIIRNDLVPAADKYKDLGTTDLLTGLLKQHEKMSWMLRAYLGGR